MRPSTCFNASIGGSYSTLPQLVGIAWPAGVQSCYLQGTADWEYNMDPLATSGIAVKAGAVLRVDNAAQVMRMQVRATGGSTLAIQTWIQ